MEIYLLRHAIAEDPARAGRTPIAPSPPKAATSCGACSTGAPGRGLPTLILSSPYRRAWKRPKSPCRALAHAGRPVHSRSLVPEASPHDLWDEIRLHRTETAILLASHEPLMSATAAFLLGCPALQVDMKKAALVRIDCDRFGGESSGCAQMDAHARCGVKRHEHRQSHRKIRSLALAPHPANGQDLEFKHQQMRTAPFPFMRATYYRWAQTWAEIWARGAGATRAGGGRSARGELRHLARHRRPPDLGHQRFRRGLVSPLSQRPHPSGFERAAGRDDLRTRRPASPRSWTAIAKPLKPADAHSPWPNTTAPCGPWRWLACTTPKSSGRSSTGCRC